MFCKYCGAELEQEANVCPSCGKEQEAQKPAKKINWMPIAACALLAVLLLGIVFVGAGGTFDSVAKLFEKRENNIFYKDSYSVSDKKLSPNTVVATIGDKVLTNGELQIYYWMQFYEFLEYTGGYPSYYGLDINTPLDEQVIDKTTGQTWQQYFLENALHAWQRYVALGERANDAGYKLPADYQEMMDNLYETLQKQAAEKEYTTVEEMLLHDMGAGASFETYKAYLYSYYLGNLYFSDLSKNIQATDQELEDFFAQNGTDAEEAYGITKDIGNMTDVRHILVKIAGGTTGEDGSVTYSDADWEACRQKAQELLDQWLAGEKTEDSFAKLATEKSEDTGSAANGGMITNVYKNGTYVPEFEEWCVSTDRKVGDYGLVKTSYGYHLMYCSTTDLAWKVFSRDNVINDKATAMLEGMDAAFPMEVTYKNIKLPVMG